MIRIRELAQGDFELVSTWLAKPDIRRWLSPDWRTGEIGVLLVAAVAASTRNKIYMVEKGDRSCGAIGLGQIDHTDRTATIWGALGDLAWRGQGIMSEALKMVAIRAFSELGIRSINVSFMEPNEAAKRLCEKAGFRFVGIVRNGLLLEGVPVNRVLYDGVPADFGLHSDSASADSVVT